MTSVTLQQSCEFPARVFLNANPKWPVTVACSTFFGVVWTQCGLGQRDSPDLDKTYNEHRPMVHC